MTKRIPKLLSAGLACIMLAGCGVSQAQLDEITAMYDAKIAALEASVAALQTDDGEENVTKDDARDRGWIIVTDYIDNLGRTDVSDELQEIIDSNPNRTIYFPDGAYRIDKPICTPADPARSVDLHLSNYAAIRAGAKWSSKDAMIRLGGIHPKNDIASLGSFYSFTGGIVDGRGVANGISIESGRETAVRNVSIKNTVVGLHIMYGANSGSSDADIYNVNIVGCGGDKSVGVLIQGYDNTLTNMRIANVHYGINLQSSGNMLRNIHPLYYRGSSTYVRSCGFYDAGGNNWYDYCYSDQFCTGFYIKGNLSNVYDSAFCYWYNGSDGKETAMRTGGKFNSLVTSIRVGFHKDSKENVVLDVGETGGNGVLQYVLVNESRVTDNLYKKYVAGKVIDS
ncbi:MAG: hypothetical protein IJY35_00820 [Clostridia bacterium]|nr:hypothetical protein [Clostridia bacterium]